MVRKNKLLKKFLENPESLRFTEIETILLQFGFKKANAKGSHIKFRHQKILNNIVVPIHNNDCKKIYKKQIAQIIKELT